LVSDALKVGWIGTGFIGKPMALRLLSNPSIALTVFDINPEAPAEIVGAGAALASSVADLAQAVDVVSIMVREDEQVRDVVGQIVASGRTGLDLVIHSTVAPGTPAALAALAAPGGHSVLDAAVSGGPMGARSGELAVMVGADPEAIERVRPVLETLGNKVVHTGPVGTGTQFKLARNLIQFVAFTAATEAQRLAEAMGLDLAALGEVVRHSDAVSGGPGAIMYRTTTGPIPEGDFWHPILSNVAALGEKDLQFVVDLADQLGTAVPLARYALQGLRPGLGITTAANS
jgi:3-hydroxyisobutyrate dehydrogenase-like beta-hydroxyacid dehydrogenase